MHAGAQEGATEGARLPPPPVRSTCMAGYKGCWSLSAGFPDAAFLDSVRPGFGSLICPKLQGDMLAPGECAGQLGALGSSLLGVPEGVPVSAATIDAHSAVPGVGVGEPARVRLRPIRPQYLSYF